MASESKQALIPIMNGQYERIAALEAPWSIRFKEGDMRPRIEHFQDAVRALTSGEADLYGKHSRLSVEYLAYDLSQLRRIQADPVGRIHKGTEKSLGTALVPQGEAEQSGRGPDRGVRNELAQLYKDYTVLFAALFAEVADMNYQARSDEVDAAVSDIALAEQIVAQLGKGEINRQQAHLLLEQIEQDTLREKLQQMVGGEMKPRDAQQLMGQLSELQGRMDTEKLSFDKAHLHYVTGQLAVYEEARETVKRLAAQGMNIAGKFVETAINQAAGKGQGRGT